jgi:hypothetical protein
VRKDIFSLTLYTTDGNDRRKQKRERAKKKGEEKKTKRQQYRSEKRRETTILFFSIDINFLGRSLAVDVVMRDAMATVYSCKSNDILQ